VSNVAINGPGRIATVAINGLGRIGRATLKILLDADGLDVVAVNDIADADNLAHLLKYDSVNGRYDHEVGASEGALIVDGNRITALAERDPAKLPWDDLGIDLALEVHRRLHHRRRPRQAHSRLFGWYIKNCGPEVNLFVDHSPIVQLECLRRGIWGTKSLWGRVVTYPGA
jgi:Glyceraldehyde 3-phosphate dehydrogenase, NAD binding domain/(2R)-phospho-3-sulfolactate synthase (ComA)